MEPILYEKKKKIAHITINRPEVLNALNMEARRGLAKAWADVRDDPEVWVAIVTGAGEKAFCAGQDLKEVGQLLAGGGALTESAQPPLPEVDPLLYLEVWKPFIVAINGIATGAGLELALACDLRIVAENARLGLAETKRGLIPGGGGTQRLPRSIPLCKALEILMTGDFIDAQEAYQMGLVNKVVPMDELLPTAEELANRICENGPLAVRAVKELAYRGLKMPLVEGLRLESTIIQQIFKTEDVKEGLISFIEKRKPVYTGT